MHQQPESLERVELALNGDQERVRRDDGVDGEQPKAGWGIDQHVVVIGGERFQRVLETTLASREINKLDLGTRQGNRRWHNVQAWDGRFQARLGQRSSHHDDVVDACLDAAPIDAKSGRGIGLWVDVDQEHLPPHLSERSAHADRGGGLSDAALLVGDRENTRWHG